MVGVRYGTKELPRVLCGSSPFMGAGQFGVKGQEWYHHFFHNPERMSNLFDHFCELGFPGAQVVGYPTIVEAARLTKQHYPLKVCVSLLPENWKENLGEVSALEPDVVFVHGAMTDTFLARRTQELLDCFRAIREIGAFPGLSTHDTHQTLQYLHSDSNSLIGEDFGLLLPLNSNGWGMGASVKEVVELLNGLSNKHPVMGMKVLAAGKLPPREALEFVLGLNAVSTVAVGITNKSEASEITEIVRHLA